MSKGQTENFFQKEKQSEEPTYISFNDAEILNGKAAKYKSASTDVSTILEVKHLTNFDDINMLKDREILIKFRHVN